MAGKTQLKMTMDLSPLKKLAQKSPKEFSKAMAKGGIQFLNWSNAGSARTPKKPPIRWGILRGSSSVFIGNQLVNIFDIQIRPGAQEAPTPAQSHRAPPLTLTFVWNTDYATRMHEHKGSWGPYTQQDGNAGSKWLEEHLQKDKDDLMAMIAKEFGKSTGLT